MFSWDIMEPITCGMTLADSIFSYTFWLWAGKPWDLDGLKAHFFERRMKKLLKKHNMDYFYYQQLYARKLEILDKLRHND